MCAVFLAGAVGCARFPFRPCCSARAALPARRAGRFVFPRMRGLAPSKGAPKKLVTIWLILKSFFFSIYFFCRFQNESYKNVSHEFRLTLKLKSKTATVYISLVTTRAWPIPTPDINVSRYFWTIGLVGYQGRLQRRGPKGRTPQARIYKKVYVVKKKITKQK